MTGSHQPRVGIADLSGGQYGHVADLRDVVVRLPDRDPAAGDQAPVIHVGNVVPFARSRREATPAHEAPEVPLTPAGRPAPLLTERRRSLFAAFLVLSIASHSALYFLFNREPEPMASIGIEAISVELVLGDNRQAGAAETPGSSPATNVPADNPDPVPTDTQTATASPDMVREAKPAEVARTITADPTPREAKSEQAPVVTATETPPERVEQTAQLTTAIPVAETPAARAPELTVAPEVSEEPKPADPVKPEPQPVRTETRPEPAPKPKPVETREPKRKAETAAQRKRELPGPVSRTASNNPEGAGARQLAASGAGPGRSDANSNYPGIVAAHLRRYQRSSHSEQGTAVVRFGLDGSGRVMSASLTRSSGHASLDQEAVAMVRRASPFPPPPPGVLKNFTVPLRFAVR